MYTQSSIQKDNVTSNIYTNWTRTKASNCIFYQPFMKGFGMEKKMIPNAFIHAKLDGNFQNSGNFQGLF